MALLPLLACGSRLNRRGWGCALFTIKIYLINPATPGLLLPIDSPVGTFVERFTVLNLVNLVRLGAVASLRAGLLDLALVEFVGLRLADQGCQYHYDHNDTGD